MLRHWRTRNPASEHVGCRVASEGVSYVLDPLAPGEGLPEKADDPEVTSDDAGDLHRGARERAQT